MKQSFCVLHPSDTVLSFGMCLVLLGRNIEIFVISHRDQQRGHSTQVVRPFFHKGKIIIPHPFLFFSYNKKKFFVISVHF